MTGIFEYFSFRNMKGGRRETVFTKSDGIFLSFSLCEPRVIKNKNTKSKNKNENMRKVIYIYKK